MKHRSLFLTLALACAVAIPSIASAQQAPPAPASAPATGEHEHHHHGMMHRMLRGVTLTAQQKTQIKQLVSQYRQAHPEGSQPDPQAHKQLQDSIFHVLTPAQQAQVKANMAQMHNGHHPDRDDTSAPAPQPTP